MVVKMISSKDITVVVQGAIDKENTPKSLKSIRKYLPDAEIIISTWEGSDVSNLDFDVLVLNKDPGAEICDRVYNIKNNVNRQIISTINGLKKSTRKYAMKLRSDIIIKNTNFIKKFSKFDNFRCDDCKIFKNRVIINNLYCANPKLTNFPFHISDWVQFGLLEDLINLWDIPLQSKYEGCEYFNNNPRPKNDIIPTWLMRYVPEQHIGISCLRKNGVKFNCENYSDLSDENLKLSEQFFANNFVILDYENYGIKFLKYNPYKWDYKKQMTYFLWLEIYKKYCDKEFKYPLSYKISNSNLAGKFEKLFKHIKKLKECFLDFCSEMFSCIFYIIKIVIQIITLGLIK